MTDRPMTAAEYEDLGYTVDRHCYPWVAYLGPRFAPTSRYTVPTDTETALRRLLDEIARETLACFDAIGQRLPAYGVALGPLCARLSSIVDDPATVPREATAIAERRLREMLLGGAPIPPVSDLRPHHPDCDGWMALHRTAVVQVSTEGRGILQAQCLDDDCDWVGTLVGPDARDLAARERREHAGEPVECDGRCRSWQV